MEDPQPPEFWSAVEQFNGGEFYQCHDTLEALWIEAVNPDKTFYQGILQIAVGIYHLSNLNWRGAAILLGEGMGRLAKTPWDDRGCYGGIQVQTLLSEAQALLMALQTHGEDQVEPLAIALGLRKSGSESGSEEDAIAAPPLPRIHLDPGES
ncbi:MAG: DUF309 domain-containing protein [Cyanobacteria bacterium]|nr:DUF309 domain-containing protein [Cyanobacteriota bacterium]